MELAPAELCAALVDELADKGWSIREHFLDPASVAELAEECRSLWQHDAFHDAGVGQGDALLVRPGIRSDQVLWLDEQRLTPPQRRYFDKLETLRLAANRELQLGLFDFEGHLAVYPPGSFYGRHLDCFQNSNRRALTCILYLNGNWREEDGGQLRFYLEDGPDSPYFDVAPRGGTLVTFLSDRFYHEVLPARRERLSLTGWFRRRA